MTAPNWRERIALQKQLKGSIEQQENEVKRITITMNSPVDINVRFDGSWTGHLLKAAERQMHREYKKIKYDRIRDAVALRREEQLNG